MIENVKHLGIYLFKKKKLTKCKNPQSLQTTQIARLNYNKCCRVKKAIHDKNTTDSHVKLKYKNPRLFWKTINPRTNQKCPVTLDTFYTYISELCSQNITPTNICMPAIFMS